MFSYKPATYILGLMLEFQHKLYAQHNIIFRGWLGGGTVPLRSTHQGGTVPPHSTHRGGTGNNLCSFWADLIQPLEKLQICSERSLSCKSTYLRHRCIWVKYSSASPQIIWAKYTSAEARQSYTTSHWIKYMPPPKKIYFFIGIIIFLLDRSP